MNVVTEECFLSFILAFIDHGLDEHVGCHEVTVLGVDQALVIRTLDVLFIDAEQGGKFDLEVFLLSLLDGIVLRPLSA